MVTKSNKIRDGLSLAALLREEFLRHWIGSAVVLTLVVFFVIPTSGQQNLFAKVRALIEEKNYSGAEKTLTQMKGPLSPADIALSSFVRGVLSFELQKYNEAQSHLEKALYYSQSHRVLCAVFLGLSLQAKREFKEAQREYDRLLKLRPPSQLAYETKFKISEMLIDQGKWSKALPELAYLERRWRSSETYPEILWRLVKVEMQSGRKWRACAWARRLYSKYPQHGLIDDWGIDLASSPFDGKSSDASQRREISRSEFVVCSGPESPTELDLNLKH
ncbi:MAG: tetratricopeptide repeat protein [Bdellovibrionales bacterium]|nr:tetratricopeptide repeat protein [Bdellovibrionales bacterium]